MLLPGHVVITGQCVFQEHRSGHVVSLQVTAYALTHGEPHDAIVDKLGEEACPAREFGQSHTGRSARAPTPAPAPEPRHALTCPHTPLASDRAQAYLTSDGFCPSRTCGKFRWP